MLDSSTGADIFDDELFVAVEMRGNELKNGLTDDLLAGVAKDATGGVVPAGDDSVEVFGENGVVGGFYDGCQFGQTLGCLLGVSREIDSDIFVPTDHFG